MFFISAVPTTSPSENQCSGTSGLWSSYRLRTKVRSFISFYIFQFVHVLININTVHHPVVMLIIMYNHFTHSFTMHLYRPDFFHVLEVLMNSSLKPSTVRPSQYWVLKFRSSSSLISWNQPLSPWSTIRRQPSKWEINFQVGILRQAYNIFGFIKLTSFFLVG